jgi:hypothetical protein
VRELIRTFDFRAPKTAFEEEMDRVILENSLVGTENLFSVSVEDS